MAEINTQFDIVVVGSCIVDFISYVPRLPKPGETLHGRRLVTGYGGKGCNQAMAANKLGSRTSMIGKVGNDYWGKNYIKYLLEEGVYTEFLNIVEDENTGMAQINVADSGENQIVIIVGANNQLGSNDINDAWQIINNSKVLICQLETPIKGTIEALKRFTGVSIINASPALENIPIELLRLPSIFCVNEVEATSITSIPVDNLIGAKSALEKLIQMGCNTVIITLGAEGAIFGSKDTKIIHVPAIKAEKVVDTTGAGDAFLGALGHFTARYPDMPLKQRIGGACAIASLSVQKAGTQISFPKMSEVPFDLNTQTFNFKIM